MVCAGTHQWFCKKEILPNQYSYVRRARAPIYLRREAGKRGRMALNT